MESEVLEKIKTLHPFDEMSEGDLAEITSKATLSTFAKGKMIFKRADEDSKVYWLVTGSIDLLDEKFEAKNRKAGEDVVRNPIDNNSPHRLTAVSTEESRILSIERAYLGGFGGDNAGASIDEVEEEGIDWMSTLLSSPLFEFIPPANIQTLFGKFEEIQYKKDDVVIKQGDAGDFFYVIQAGRAKVERGSGEKTALVAKFQAGDNFGADALVSEIPRNATITMTTNGTLMRLSAPDFQSLLVSPVIEKVTLEEANEMIEHGDPKTYIIDVRSPKEMESDKLPGSLNLPLQLLRKNYHKLKIDGVYVMADEGGKRAELGAYLLNEQGRTAYVLKREDSS